MRDHDEDAKALVGRGISAIRASLRRGAVRPEDLVRACLAGIVEAEDLNAVVEIRPQAVEEASIACGPLAGVPVLVKDCFVDGGRPPTMGSRARAWWLRETAEVLRRVRRAGAVVVGYANLHEWMVGTTCLVSAFGPVLNPRDPELIPGGSSGGCSAALAAGLVPMAIGTDAGGSIRIPAACCEVVGLKPTWGRVPTEGFVDHGSSIDHVGPMARSVEDVGLLLEAMTDSRIDRFSTAGLRLGLARAQFFDDADPLIAERVEAAVKLLEPHVSGIQEVAIDGAEEARRTIGSFILGDVARMLAEDGRDPNGLLEPETDSVISIGRSVSGEDRARAEVIRKRVRAGWDRAFQEVDVVVSPTLPGRVAGVADGTVALRHGTSSAEPSYVAWNGPMNLGGVPCLSLPCGRFGDRGGVSLSLTADRGRDGTVLALGSLLESLVGPR